MRKAAPHATLKYWPFPRQLSMTDSHGSDCHLLHQGPGLPLTLSLKSYWQLGRQNRHVEGRSWSSEANKLKTGVLARKQSLKRECGCRKLIKLHACLFKVSSSGLWLEFTSSVMHSPPWYGQEFHKSTAGENGFIRHLKWIISLPLLHFYTYWQNIKIHFKKSIWLCRFLHQQQKQTSEL